MTDLNSNSIYRGLYVISEGEIQGVSGTTIGNGIYANDVPLVDVNGGVTVNGLSYNLKTGTQNQSYTQGFDSSNSPVQVAQKVLYATPYSVSVPSSYDAIILTTGGPALYRIDDSGNVKGQDLEYYIEYQVSGSSTWVTSTHELLKYQSTTSSWELSYRVDLPPGQGPFNVRLRRAQPDSTNSHINDLLYFQRYETVINGKFKYPNVATLGIQIDAEQFGNTIPKISALVIGLKISVPTNYDPNARTYATSGAGTSNGIWDGTFKKAYSNNPAWVFYDLLISNRYGIGQELNPNCDPNNALVDKWSLYNIAQYCDQFISDGYGSLEPRFTFNAYITDKQDAYKFLQDIAASFRGMIYFASDSIFTTADIPPAGYDDVFNNTDVVDGVFTYTGTPLKTRSTAVVSKYRDPKNLYKVAYERVEDVSAIYQFGYRERTLEGTGVASRGLARRLAKWQMLTEKYQTQTVAFSTGLRGGQLMPGGVIKIIDSYKMGVRKGGKILSTSVGGSSTTFTIDGDAGYISGTSQSINVSNPDNSNTAYPITGATNTGGIYTVTIGTAITVVPIDGAGWVVTSPTLDAQQYRTISVKESSKGMFDIVAIQHYPNKYALIESGPQFDNNPTTLLSNTALPAPANLVHVESYETVNGSEVAPHITASWPKVADNRATSYQLQLNTSNGGFIDVYQGSNISWYSPRLPIGTATYQLQVRTVCDSLGIVSPWIQTPLFNITGKTTTPTAPTGLGVQGTFNSIIATWINSTDTDFNYVEVWTSSDSTLADATLAGQTKANTFTISNLAVAVTLYVWIRAISYASTNNQSAFVGPLSATTRAIGTPDIATQSITAALITDGTITAAKIANATIDATKLRSDTIAAASTAAGIAAIPVVSSLPSAASYSGTQPVLLTTDNKLYRIVSGAWVPQVSVWGDLTVPNSAITNSMLASNAVDATKLATGAVTAAKVAANAIGYSALTTDLEPPQNVSSLPTVAGYTGSSIVFNTTDGKLYRLVSGAWTSATAGSDVTGTIAASVVPSLDASKISTGTLATALIPGLDASKIVSGQFGSSQISSVLASVVSGTLAAANIPSLDASKITTGTFGTSQIAAAAITSAKIATGLTLPLSVTKTNMNDGTVTSPAANSLAYNSSDGKMYRNPTSGATSGWVVVYQAASDISGTLTSSQIASVAASTVTGTLTSSQIASVLASAVSGTLPATQVGNGLTGTQISAGTITGTNIAGTTITGSLIAANTIAAGNLVANTITAGQIAANTITAGQIAAGTITATQIAANTIAAQNLVLSSRGINVTGMLFSYNASNVCSWTAGSIQYTDNSGATQTAAIATGSVTWTTGTQYIYWTLGATTLSTTTTLATALAATAIIIASYTGGAGIYANYGQTVISGGNIFTGSITTSQIAAGTITGANIAGTTITGSNIAATTIAAGNIVSGTITTTQIASGTIVAGNIASGTIVAGNIASGTITTTNLNIGSQDNLIPNPNSDDAVSSGYGSNGLYNFGASAYNGSFVRRVQGAGASTYSTPIVIGNASCVAGDQFYIEAQALLTVAGTAGTNYGYVETQFLNSSGTAIGYGNNATTSIGTTYSKTSMYGTAPAGATSVNFYISSYGLATSSYAYFDAIYARKLLQGNLVIDGTLSASKIVSGSITATQIAGGTITGDRLVGGTITGTYIAANAIGTTQLAANAVTAGSIAAGAVVASKLSVVGDNLCKDPNFTDGSYWQGSTVQVCDTSGNVTSTAGYTSYSPFTGGWYQDTTNPAAASTATLWVGNTTGGYGFANKRYALYMNWANQTDQASLQRLMIPVTVNTIYEMQAYVNNQSNQQCNVQIDWFTNAGVYVSSSGYGVIAGASGLWNWQVTSPSNGVYGRMVVYNDAKSTMTGYMQVATIRMRNAASTSMYVDGTINATKLVANSITAGQIQAGAISTSQLAAGAVTATQIASSTISADKLAVGLGSNLLWGSDQSMDPTYFIGAGITTSGSIPTTLCYSINGAGTNWTTADQNTYEFCQPNSTRGVGDGYIYYNWYKPIITNKAYAGTGAIQLEPGMYYEVSGYIQTHRCDAMVNLIFYDSSNNYLGEIRGTSVNNSVSAYSDGKSLGNYFRSFVCGQAPATTAYGAFRIIKAQTNSGSTDSYAFVNQCQIVATGSKTTATTAASPWSPPGVTFINGGSLVTNTITADKIAANSITSAQILAGSITADRLQASNLTVSLGVGTSGKITIDGTNNRIIITD